MMTDVPPKWSARGPLFMGFLAVGLLVSGVGLWSIRVQIAGAVVAPGTVQVVSDRQVVQHPDGGVVGELLARDGDIVQAGDVLVRLDGTFLRSELAIVEQQIAEIFARRTRLAAERDDASTVSIGAFPHLLLVTSKTVSDQVKGQENLFKARRVSLEQERKQLSEQQLQIERQIEGVSAQRDAFERQRILIGDELEDSQSLLVRGLIPTRRVLELRREEARLNGEIGRLIAAAAEAETRISELEIQKLRLVDTRREDAIAELRDLEFSESGLEEQRLSLTEKLSRLEVRAPVSGVIFDSRVVGRQSVIKAAQTMMYVVPGDQPLQVAARIDPKDIEQVYPGQDVSLMFTTFNQRRMPEIPGVVRRVAADADTDDATGVRFYEAVILPNEDRLASLSHIRLLPGMPVETFLRTENRTPLAYLTQPLTVYFTRAFREE